MVLSNAGVPVGTQSADEAVPDTLIVVGGDLSSMMRPAEISSITTLAARTPRIASVCTGAFLLAETGLLDGRRATTRWRAAQRLQRRYPAVNVEVDRIFVVDSHIWTSAGITAGIDLALALIEADLGVEMAREVARHLVVYHRRPSTLRELSGLQIPKECGALSSICMDCLHRPCGG